MTQPATSPSPNGATPAALGAAPRPLERRENSQIIALTPKGLDALVRHANRKGTLLNLWATWCGPCREELPLLAKLNREYMTQGLEVIPLSVDEPERYKDIAPMLQDYGFEGPYYIVAEPLADMKQYLSEHWAGNVPVSFLLGSDASRHFFFGAQVYEDELRPKLNLFLEGKLEAGQADYRVAPGKTF